MTSDTRPTPAWRGDEKTTLLGFLDFLRATLMMKCEGLTSEQLRSTPTVSSLSLLGIVRHLGYVERQWFQGVMDDRQVFIPWHHDEDEFEIPEQETDDDVFAFYRTECEISDEIARSYAMEDLATWFASEDTRRSLRWILVHMIEETARHCGHADIIREAIDGTTGE